MPFDPVARSAGRAFAVLRGPVSLVIAAGMIWLRCPSILLNAQFWAEDGWVWYPDAYTTPWVSLILPHAGYLQTISRLGALISRLVPLADAPIIFAVIALLVQAAVPAFLVSPRMEHAIPSLKLRIGLALLLVLLPGTPEVFVNLTNSQWHLSLLAFLVLAAAPADTLWRRAFDIAILALSGLSGPFEIFLVPVGVLWLWRGRHGWQVWRLGIVAITATIQLGLILALPHQRTAWMLGASADRLIHIVVKQVLGVAAIGVNGILQTPFGAQSGWFTDGTPAVTWLGGAILATAVLLALLACWRGSWILRAFVLFAGMEFVASLVDPIIGDWWHIMEIVPGGRYFLHPIMAWLAIVVTLAIDRAWPVRLPGLALLAATIILAIPADWAIPALPVSSFARQAEDFSYAAVGTVIRFDIRPAETMVLSKH